MSVQGGRRILSACVPAALLAGLLLTAFHGALAGRLFYLRDLTQNHRPMRALVTGRLASGELPLWDPYHGGGTPLLADPNHLVLHPISLLFLALPFEAAFTASILLQYALLAWGTYRLARALPVGREAAAWAAAVMSLSGPAASLASMQNVLSATAWVPLALWAMLEVLDTGKRRHRILAVVSTAIVLSTGEAASILALLVLAPILALTREAPKAAPAGRGSAARTGGTLAVIVALAALLAAIQIAPTAALLPLTPRGAGLSVAETLKWSLVPSRLLELVVPRLFGDPTRLSPAAWWGGWLFEGGVPFLLSIYVGAAPIAIALGALLPGAGRRRSVWLAAATSSFGLLALGAHTPLGGALFGSSALLRQVRYPERFLLGALLGGALLAAIGLQRLMQPGQPARSLLWLVPFAALFFVAATLLAAEPTLADRLLGGALRVPSAFLQTEAAASVRGALLRSTLWAFAESAGAIAGAVLLARAPQRFKSPVAWSVVLLSAASMTAAAAPARSTAAPGWLSDPSPLAAVVGHGPAAVRLSHAPRPPGLSIWARTDEQIWGYRFDRFSYSLLTGHPDRVPTILDPSTDRLDLAASANLGARLAARPLADQIRILRICHVGLLLSYDDLSGEELESGPSLLGLSRPELRVYRVKDPLDRVRFVGRVRAPLDADDVEASLLDRRFDPEREALVEGLRSDATAGNDASGTTRMLQDDPERVRIGVEANGPGYLIVADSCAPGWSARVDGAPAPILRANGLFRAIAVPSGRHEVEMRYLPASVVLGAVLSACGALFAGVWSAWRREPLR